MNDIIWTIISMAVIGVLVFGFFAWYFRGFLIPYTKARTSRGHKLLVKVRTPIIDYFVNGYEEGDVVVVKTRSKTHRLAIKNNSNLFYRMLGVVCFDLDDNASAIVTRDYKLTNPFDMIQFDNMYTQALSKPTPKNVKEIIVLVLLIVVLFAVLFMAFKVGNLETQLEAFSVARDVAGVNL